jgi:hypothetical protein
MWTLPELFCKTSDLSKADMISKKCKNIKYLDSYENNII